MQRYTMKRQRDSDRSSQAASSHSNATQQPKRKIRKIADGSNIQVVVRLCGRNGAFRALNSPIVAEPSPEKPNQQVLLKATNKLYTFDRVFDQNASQERIFVETVKPIVEDVLQGYSCTIFAYGQTGTGKTFTMEGDLAEVAGKHGPQAGILPRVIHHLFQILEAQGTEHTVKLSFLELYNEELRDLLNTSGEGASLKMYEDRNASGVVVQGLQEVYIRNALEGLRVLQTGSRQRTSASTKCNDHSSRSHGICTLTVHMQEQKPGAENVMRVGKLNLVDLAGSENIGRSGAEHQRAREAGVINQSLLTLGRVINHLVENSAHIPYRESKLTRLLKDSLGGHTRTCMIATISIAKLHLDEITSTLEYASRAKNIRNRPEANQCINRNVYINDLINETEQLRADLRATWEKSGVHLSLKSYENLKNENSAYKDEIATLQETLRSVKEQLEYKDELLQASIGEEKRRTARLSSMIETFKKCLPDSLAASVKPTGDRFEDYLVAGEQAAALINNEIHAAHEKIQYMEDQKRRIFEFLKKESEREKQMHQLREQKLARIAMDNDYDFTEQKKK